MTPCLPGVIVRSDSRSRQRLNSPLLASLCGLLLAGCGPSQAQFDDVLEENAGLRAELESTRAELDELANGPDRLLALARTNLEGGSYRDAISHASALRERHPESPQSTEVAQIAAAAQQRLDEEQVEVERRRLAEEEAQEGRRAAAVQAMQSRYDEVREVTIYHDRNVSRFVNSGGSRMLLYMVQTTGRPPSLRFSIRYIADSWLFVEGYTLRVDEQSFQISPGFGDVERDNGAGGIWEWYDVPAGSRELQIVRAVIASDRTILRYNGSQYYHDRIVTAAEKRALQNVLDAFDALSDL